MGLNIFKRKEKESIGSFADLEELVNSGEKTISFDCDYVFDENENVDHTELGIYIREDGLTIDGNGHTIDAKGKSTIFSNASNNVTFKNIIFKNAFSTKNGGALVNFSSCVVDYCIFENNSAGNLGGCIVNICEHPEDKMLIRNSKFIHNSAYQGGAIMNTPDGRLQIENCEFIGNKSEDYGGIILNRGNLEVKYSSFEDSNAFAGAGIFCDSSTLTRVYASQFRGNKSKMGGAVFNAGEFHMSDCILDGNYSKLHGGAIESQNGILNIYTTIFRNNDGGTNAIIHFMGDTGDLKLNNCGFENNTPENVEELYNIK